MIDLLTFTPSCCTVRTQKTAILLSALSSLAPKLGPAGKEGEGEEGRRGRSKGEEIRESGEEDRNLDQK